MARRLRLDHPGARHHVYNRSARREQLFTTDSHCAAFMHVLAQLGPLFGVRVHGYALMPNHFHLMLETPRGNLSKAMRHFGAELTQALNGIEDDWDGPVFGGRFHNRIVEDDDYWRYLLLYLHLNPVKARLVSQVDESRWTSHGAYGGLRKTQDWLATDELLALYGGPEGYAAAITDARSGKQRPPDGFDEERLWIPGARTAEATPREAPVRPTVTEATRQVARVTGRRQKDLRAVVKGPGGNPGRRVLAWWLVRSAGLTQAQAGKHVSASKNLVSLWCANIQKGREQNRHVVAWAAELLAESAND
jgi:REP element-mobilizing transposase RayT